MPVHLKSLKFNTPWENHHLHRLKTRFWMKVLTRYHHKCWPAPCIIQSFNFNFNNFNIHYEPFSSIYTSLTSHIQVSFLEKTDNTDKLIVGTNLKKLLNVISPSIAEAKWDQ